MKKLTTLILLLLSPLVIAQEKEIWACQQIAGTMLKWEGSSWKSTGLAGIPLLLTLDGENSSFKMGDRVVRLTCSTTRGRLSCLNVIKSAHILMDLNSGRMGMSSLFGAVMAAEEDSYKDSIDAEAFNCTKF